MSALPPFIVGHAVRTTNAAESDPQQAQLGALWARVIADDALLHSPARADARLYAALFDYDSDETGAYTQIVGIGVDASHPLPPHLAIVRVADAPRAEYAVVGEMPGALIAAWGRVWTDTADGSLRRAFSCDVEVHDPDGSAAILVATRP